MYEHLRDHAMKNVWCNPEQDNQIIVAAKRITAREGELVSFSCMKRRLNLPTKDVRYHVFQIGQAHPVLLGMLSRTPDWLIPTWKKISDAVDLLPLYANLYADSGVSIPLHRSYYMYTADRALIIAVDEASKSPMNFRADQVYLRLYTNAYYESDPANNLLMRTRVFGRKILNTDDILAIQNLLPSYRSQPGIVFCFINGHLVDNIDLITAKIGDVVEFHYDASVKAIHEFQVKDLETFPSELDDCYKYLIHPKGKSLEIDYLDEVDTYIISKNGERYKGRFFHRNNADSIRMVTHRDYSIKVHQFEVIANGLANAISQEPLDLRDFYVRIYIRQGGMKRPLIYDNNRIFELYKLDDQKILNAMLGVNSSMQYWRAETLEASAYTELKRTRQENIDIDIIERAYGYNSITRVIADMPVKVKDFTGYSVADLPIALYQNSTIYEYDQNGYLLGFYYHEYGTTYHPRHPETRMIEGVYGKGSHSPSIKEGSDAILVPSDNSYRVYMCYVIDGVPTRQWKDITGSDHYKIENNVLIWQNHESDQWLQVRTDESFLAYNLELGAVAGTFYFDLSEYIGGDHHVMRIPMGDLDIWMNGRNLIYGLDYFVEFPRVYIVSKEHFAKPTESTLQQITVRFTGFCDKELNVMPIEDFGFVVHGMLSNDKQYDIRDDKVIRISVRGQLRHRDDLIFGELTEGIAITDPANGSPYQIKDIVVPLDFLAEEETYKLRQKSLEIDKAVEDYMTVKLPEPIRNAVSAIPNRYILMSPFFSHLVNDLTTKMIDHSKLTEVLSDDDVLEICKPYEKFLEFDPINPENGVEQRFVVIHPTDRFTPIPLDLYSYRFMQRVNELYGRNLISLSPHLVVSLGGN